eukprot:g4409.t1
MVASHVHALEYGEGTSGSATPLLLQSGTSTLRACAAGVCAIGAPMPRIENRVERIYLSTNHLRDLAGIEVFQEAVLVSVAHNLLPSVASLKALRALPKLTRLSVQGNPLTAAHGWRVRLVGLLPQLIWLDGKKVTDSERSEAREETKVRNLLYANQEMVCKLQAAAMTITARRRMFPGLPHKFDLDKFLRVHKNLPNRGEAVEDFVSRWLIRFQRLIIEDNHDKLTSQQLRRQSAAELLKVQQAAIGKLLQVCEADHLAPPPATPAVPIKERSKFQSQASRDISPKRMKAGNGSPKMLSPALERASALVPLPRSQEDMPTPTPSPVKRLTQKMSKDERHLQDALFGRQLWVDEEEEEEEEEKQGTLRASTNLRSGLAYRLAVRHLIEAIRSRRSVFGKKVDSAKSLFDSMDTSGEGSISRADFHRGRVEGKGIEKMDIVSDDAISEALADVLAMRHSLKRSFHAWCTHLHTKVNRRSLMSTGDLKQRSVRKQQEIRELQKVQLEKHAESQDEEEPNVTEKKDVPVLMIESNEEIGREELSPQPFPSPEPSPMPQLMQRSARISLTTTLNVSDLNVSEREVDTARSHYEFKLISKVWGALVPGAVLDARDELEKVHEKLLLQKTAYEKMKHDFHTTKNFLSSANASARRTVSEELVRIEKMVVEAEQVAVDHQERRSAEEQELRELRASNAELSSQLSLLRKALLEEQQLRAAATEETSQHWQARMRDIIEQHRQEMDLVRAESDQEVKRHDFAAQEILENIKRSDAKAREKLATELEGKMRAYKEKLDGEFQERSSVLVAAIATARNQIGMARNNFNFQPRQDSAAAQFSAITGVSAQEGAIYIEAAGGNLEVAVQIFFSGGGSAQPTASGSGSAPGWYDLVWGGEKTIPEAWMEQGLQFFKGDSQPFSSLGLVQGKNGPCGVLAALNAVLVANLMGKGVLSASYVPSKEDLADALCEILQAPARASNSSVCALARWRDGEPKSSKDSVEFDEVSLSNLGAEVRSRIDSFMSAGGCLLLVYSLVQTRGAEAVRRDEAESGGADQPLIYGAFSLCTSELISLMLRGTANGSVSAYNMSGAKVEWPQLRIGMLSLDEVDHGGAAVLADELKSPLESVWILHGRDHFTFCFCPEGADERSLATANGATTTFTMYHWNGLPPGQALSKITVSSTGVTDAAPPTAGQAATFFTPVEGEIFDVVQANPEHKKRSPKSWQSWDYEVVLHRPDPDHLLYGKGKERGEGAMPRVYEQGSPLTAGKWRCATCYVKRHETFAFALNEGENCQHCGKSASEVGWSIWMPFADLTPRWQYAMTKRYQPKFVTLIGTKWPRCTCTFEAGKKGPSV